MILVYRPELQNPPMAKEASIGFSFIKESGRTEFFKLESGVNRDVSEARWEAIKEKSIVKRLLSLGALRVELEAASDEQEIIPSSDTESLKSLDVQTSLRLIEDSFDINQLQKWESGEKRIRVKNSIHKRISAITEGNG